MRTRTHLLSAGDADGEYSCALPTAQRERRALIVRRLKIAERDTHTRIRWTAVVLNVKHVIGVRTLRMGQQCACACVCGFLDTLFALRNVCIEMHWRWRRKYVVCTITTPSTYERVRRKCN